MLGLLSGFTPLFARAPAVALEAHAIGVLLGTMLLFALAAIWPTLAPSRVIVRVARYSALAGFYANWVGAQLAGFSSARALFAASGAPMPPSAARWMEWRCR